ncbi:antiviral reverse transcriptase Drt3b [Asinibacterium sp. OR53]|uniref:antiviral reverse transcriptase Drt3b n=1 Tax=Asinibacterium sp. OR53 TaxID=925409 RepID=UPI000479E071|nr:antiviral reverse transcriptase Drt3b [Asinibacterium sp. OR53]
MKRKKIPINYSKERVILSDVLPFEIPITYSNRHFYNFLVKNKIKVAVSPDGCKKIVWPKEDLFIEEILKLLLGFKEEKVILNNEIKISDITDLKKIPFSFKISHKESDFRDLTIIHPKNQLDIIDFYEKYRDTILYYSNISRFSIRKPNKVAKYIYQKPKKLKKEFGREIDEKNDAFSKTSYKNLKHYFHIKEYSNIHRFYESYQYHQCEKKYNKLFKFDISKCFDSIYTHSIAWALLNKEIVKDTFPDVHSTFAGLFDKLMQNLNYGETNGIIIGSEFSRIFAELILQQIDDAVYKELRKEGKVHKKDYEVFRYVDDYFVFYNEETTKESIHSLFKLELRKYKLHLNDSKSKLYDKPIITELSIAKQKISDLLNKDLTFKVNEQDKTVEVDKMVEEESSIDNDIEESKEAKYKIYVSSNKLITRFKTIIKETKVEYKDILNYVLASIDKKVEKLISTYDESEKNIKKEKTYTEAFLQILDVAFFLYSASPRVNSTIKLCVIIDRITSFINRNNKDKSDTFSFDNKHKVFKKISDEVSQVLNKNKSSEHIQVETLYLLVALRELGREYRLDIRALCKYFNIEINNADEKKFEIRPLNYFSITVLFFYIKDADRYKHLRYALMKHVTSLFKVEGRDNIRKKAELVFLLMDMLTCPYLDDQTKTDKEIKYRYKKKLLSLSGVDSTKHIGIIEKEKFWFTKWTDFKFGHELEAKRSQEVYS